MADLAELLAKVQQASQQLQEKQQALEEETRKLQKDRETVADEQLNLASIVSLNVGGARFDTTLTTLTARPDSLLAEMLSGRHVVVREANNFIDRDPTRFRAILNWLRDYPDGVVPVLNEGARAEVVGVVLRACLLSLPLSVVLSGALWISYSLPCCCPAFLCVRAVS